MIRLHGLHKFFNRGRPNEIHVLNGIDLELPDRGMVAVFGKSGCGKTTLLNVIGGLDGYAGGQVEVDGQDIGRDTDHLRNRYMGYIFQNYNLNKQISVFDNVADALRLCGVTDKAEIESRVMAALSNVGMEKFRNRVPDSLSGGQQQRVAIARAIVKNPRIVLADEPTGNLDEANTVLIMDLLRGIAKDHLVILVTHEAALVDHYCDRVIELKDGRVVAQRENRITGGFAARNKNDIFLGELEKTEIGNGCAEITCYGDAPAEPIRMTVVMRDGRTYIRLDTPGVQVLDAGSEIQLREGVFEAEQAASAADRRVDMSALPPIEGRHYGRLFSLLSSIKSGYRANFTALGKGKRLLRWCMALFAANLVLNTALYAPAIRSLSEVNAAYNHNVSYVYVPTGEMSDDLLGAIGSTDSGIDYVRMVTPLYSAYRDTAVAFQAGAFETFDSYAATLDANAVLMEAPTADRLSLVCGTAELDRERNVLITTAVADALLEHSSLGYIKEYEDLLGLLTSYLRIDGQSLQIVGVVRSDEPAVYLSEMAMSRYVLASGSLSVAPEADLPLDLQLSEGQTVLLLPKRGQNDYPTVGEKVTVGGMTLQVADVLEWRTTYEAWLNSTGKSLLTEAAWLKDRADRGVSASEAHFTYLDYYYGHLDDYLAHCRLFDRENRQTLWMALDKQVTVAGYWYVDEEYYVATQYKLRHGQFPDGAAWDEAEAEASAERERLEYLYADAYYMEVERGGDFAIDRPTYALCRADYVALSQRTGYTDPSALDGNDKFMDYEMEKYVEFVTDGAGFSDENAKGQEVGLYALVHSTDMSKTEVYLERLLTEHGVKDSGGRDVLITPDSIRESLIRDQLPAIVVSLTSLGTVLLVMCICMYFIMRSSVMNRIKEIGVYRAIGVSRRNLIFRFLVETAVLTTLTVLAGYAVCSILMGGWLASAPLLSQFLCYPAWLAVVLLIFLVTVCLACGVLPICLLLRKTPAEILAKYDI